MTDNIINIDSSKREVQEIINEALEAGFEEIHLVGIKDGKVTLKTSYFKDALQTLGALEALKNKIARDW